MPIFFVTILTVILTSEWGGKMKDGELEPMEDRAELVSVGEILIDSKAMEKMVDGELLKIANENLMPYKIYLRYSMKVSGPMFFVALTGLGISLAFEGSGVYGVISGIISLLSCFVIIFSFPLHGYIVHPIYKMIRAKKIFKQAMEELRYEVMNNQTELKSLKNAFPLKVQEIVDRREKEEKDYQELLEHAKSSL